MFLLNFYFDLIVICDFKLLKLDLVGILYIVKLWGLVEEDVGGVVSGLIMVGDFIDDMIVGCKVGVVIVFLVNDVNRYFVDYVYIDLVIESLDELVEVFEEGFEGREIDVFV